MKKFFLLTIIIFFSYSAVFSQVEIKGTDSTSATKTWFTTNAKTTPDTTMVILDDGNVGIGTTTPSTKLEVNGIVSAGSGVLYPDGNTQIIAYTGSMVSYKQVITVAQSGGDKTTINGALSACTGAGPGNEYLIRVMPGTYFELGPVNCLPYVHLKGAGKHTTVIAGFPVNCADHSTIEGFRIEQGVTCMGVSPTIIHNIITNINQSGGNGIDIVDAKPWIIENEIINCNGWGIDNQGVDSDPWIIGNKIIGNTNGGIIADGTSPIINNNYFLNNSNFGIKLSNSNPDSTKPTITDNVIDSVSYSLNGKGIYMTGNVEASIIGNNIHHCEYGIWIDPKAQPSIISNNISYNFEAGIYCNSNGNSKSVVIKSNHIHSNVNQNATSEMTGIYIVNFSPIITHNNIHDNHIINPSKGYDIDYSNCTTSAPMISLNVFDYIKKPPPATPPNPTASGQYNVTTSGSNITP